MRRARTNCKTAPVAAAMQGKPLSYSGVGLSEFKEFEKLAFKDDAGDVENQRTANAGLLKASQERVAHWPNTIEALRRKKEKARTDRLDEEEARRRVIDEQEAEIARAQQKANIDKANLMLYETDDRVKTFTSKMVLAAVLEERAKQIDVARKKQDLQYEHEQKWYVLQEEALRKATKEEEKKQADMKKRAIAFKEAQLDQLDQVRQIKIKELRDAKAEGEQIAKAAQEAIEHEIREEEARKEAAKKVKEELITANERQKVLKQERKKQEALEIEQIERFAAQKELQLVERKKRIDERFAAAMERRQNIINRQAAHLKAIKDAVVERELKQARDLERERDQKEERERQKRTQLWGEIKKSRAQQIARKGVEAKKKAEDDDRRKLAWQNRVQELVDEEVQERVEAKENAIAVQNFQLMQIQERRMQQAKEKEERQLEALLVKKAIEDDDAMFKGYVNAVMSEYVKAGKQTSARFKAATPT